ncbi:MAG TPA: MSMEG_4193 family putative phosphomutase [Motilibacteraceae bacterium]|nr:MSMEG_4193 family putative phosphomutase [Motilibacteraceae bacterium]
MTTVVLLRHGRTAANSGGVLAGWTEGVGLDDTGRQQASAAAARLAGVPLAAVVASPLQRCQETAQAVLDGRGQDLPFHTEERLGEVRYGDWTGQPLKTLAKDPLWKVVQAHPSAVTFPGEGGEAMASMAQRAVAAVRDWNARLGSEAVWVAVSHGDVIKAIVADALGLHLDQFQRIVVDPASVTVINYTELRPFVVRVNDSGTELSALLTPPPKKGRRTRKASSDAVVGGGAGA